jgi:hypothetical protein
MPGKMQAAFVTRFRRLIQSGSAVPTNGGARVWVRCAYGQIGADTAYHPLDLAGHRVQGSDHIAWPPILVGRVAARGDLRERAMNDRPIRAAQHEDAHGPQTRPESLRQPGMWAHPLLQHVAIPASHLLCGLRGRDGLAAEKDELTAVGIETVDREDIEAVFTGRRLREERVNRRISEPTL